MLPNRRLYIIWLNNSYEFKDELPIIFLNTTLCLFHKFYIQIK